MEVSDRSARRVLITGASGFIGGWLVDRFRDQGWQTVGIGRRQTDVAGYHSIDLGREQSKLDALPPVDVVVHAAARSSPWGTRKQFESDNVHATSHVVDFVRRSPGTRLIFISSSSVHYRSGPQHGITEQTPLPSRPVNRYAATKRIAEQLVRERVPDAVILRPRAVFGPRDTVLLPRILAAARAGKLPWLKSRTPAIGDLIYVENLVDIVQQAADDPQIEGTFNVTNDEPIDIEAFISEVLRRLEIPLPTRRVRVGTAMAAATVLETLHALFRPRVEPAITRFGVHVFAYGKTFDITRAKQVFGTPRISLEQGLEKTLDWLRHQPLNREPRSNGRV